MISEEYVRRLRSTDWSDMRRNRIIDAGWRCDHCGQLAYDLDLHHKHYATLGHESPSDLELLCKVCHRRADIERRRQVAEDQWEARLDGWASKVYGEDWWRDRNRVEDAFEDWLAMGGA